ncbi:MAG: DUF3298 and DUF4163 domain-containing protein [Eubacteriales bacterium]|nr:DUF3298 and DUF4163 domain-containing protein [Eubacteriales bacterium]
MMHSDVQVKTRTLEAEMYHKNTLVLKYAIQYPWFMSAGFCAAIVRMNQYYAAKAQAFLKYCKQDLFNAAVEQYEYAAQNGFPTRVFEADENYTVTYKQDCAVSLYFDRYVYSGGAHGSTVRHSDTWDLDTGCRIMLWQLFPRSINSRTYVIRAVNNDIAEQIKSGNHDYFEDFEANVREYFDTDSFYLTTTGVAVYFQQYELAPYAAGIPEFCLPYSRFVMRPQCG